MKLVVDHTEGLSPYLLTDSIIPYYNPFVGGMSIDNNGNLYLSGYMQDMFVVDEYNQYPMKFFWDSTHFATVSDHGLAYYLPFVIKYDADGNIQWSNQAFVRNPENANAILATQWTSNCVKDQSVYLFGCAAMHDGLSAEYYIGDESNLLPINQYSSYFVRLNKDNGAFESCGVVPGESTCLVLGKTSVPAVINNHFMGICRSYINLNSYYLLNYFNVDGTFDHADTIRFFSSGHSAAMDVTINDDGYILCNFLADQDLTFGAVDPRRALNQVRVLDKHGFGNNGEWVGLDVKVMRTQKEGVDFKHLEYSRKIFLKLLEISRSLDDAMIEKLTAERDYEELNWYILDAMLRG